MTARRRASRQIIINIEGDFTQELMMLQNQTVNMSFARMEVKCIEANITGDTSKDVIRIHASATDVILEKVEVDDTEETLDPPVEPVTDGVE